MGGARCLAGPPGNHNLLNVEKSEKDEYVPYQQHSLRFRETN